VNGAEREILVSAYSLTIGSGIPEALVQALKRGLAVRLIADRTTPLVDTTKGFPFAGAAL
jgi:hypothetical protein